MGLPLFCQAETLEDQTTWVNGDETQKTRVQMIDKVNDEGTTHVS